MLQEEVNHGRRDGIIRKHPESDVRITCGEWSSADEFLQLSTTIVLAIGNWDHVSGRQVAASVNQTRGSSDGLVGLGGATIAVVSDGGVQLSVSPVPWHAEPKYSFQLSSFAGRGIVGSHSMNVVRSP